MEEAKSVDVNTQLVLMDPLTGVYSRALLQEKLDEELRRSSPQGSGLSLLTIDLDHFKSVNDAFGHHRGDEVLVEVAKRLQANFRSSDIIFRYGGDEFIVALPDTSKLSATVLAQRVLDGVSSERFAGDPPLSLSLSIGLAHFPDEAEGCETLLGLADKRAYAAKRRGRGQICADDLPTSDTLHFADDSRLVERDCPLETIHDFLGNLPGAGRGTLMLDGPRGAGRSRFLREIGKVAKLRGYSVIHLSGEPIVLSASDAGLYEQVVNLFTALKNNTDDIEAIVEAINRGAKAGLLITVDEDDGSLSQVVFTLLSRLFLSPDVPVMAVVCATGALHSHALPPTGVTASAYLAPLSPEGLQIWLRSLLQYECPHDFVAWLHAETDGLPSYIQKALLYLAETGMLQQKAGEWKIVGDPTLVTIRERLGLQEKEGAHSAPHNLPRLPYSFVGRSQEMVEVEHLLGKGSLVTLLGPGGIGKTHLALHVARHMLTEMRDGVFFVDLSSVRDPGLVVPTIAETLGVRIAHDRPLLSTLAQYLRDKVLLLVLDNFEQVTGAAPVVSDLLRACAHLKVLVTSRNPLHLRGETQYFVPPLALPTSRRDSSPDIISAYPAIELFVDRAQAVKPKFELTDENVADVVSICARLDGLPLAIELVAAHIKLQAPKALLARLTRSRNDSSLELLAGGGCDMPERHKTLRDTIAWSYDLLSTEGKKMFRLLGAFEGSCPVEAVEVIWNAVQRDCGAPPSASTNVLDTMSYLLDKSLLRIDDTPDSYEPRFSMLETIREFSAECLQESGEAANTRREHALYYLFLAQEAEPHLAGNEQKRWLHKLSLDLDNYRAALRYASECGDNDILLRLTSALWGFWWMHEHINEGRSWLQQALSKVGEALSVERAKALNGAGVLARNQCDYSQANVLLKESLAQWQGLGDKRGIANSLNSLGLVALDQGYHTDAEPYFEESLLLERDLGDRRRVAISLNNLGGVALYKGDYGRAVSLFEESLQIRRELGDNWGIANSLHNLGEVAHHQQYYEHAATLHKQSLLLRRDLGDKRGVAACLEGLASALASADTATGEKACVIFAAAGALRQSTGTPRAVADRAELNHMVASIRTALGEPTFAKLWAQGCNMDLEEVIAYAAEA